MRLFRLATLCCAVVLTAALATAQQDGLDLPIMPPDYVGNAGKPPAPDPEVGEDPRDEPPPIIYGEEIDSESDTIIYVLDTSGSMDWDYQNYVNLDGQRVNGPRIDRAKTELVRSISALPKNFKFNVVAFSCWVQPWRWELQEANDANKQAASGWVLGLQPYGGTGTGPAVAVALFERENMSIVLLTDGAPNCGTLSQSMEEHRRMIRDNNTQHATINVFGIAASGGYRAFCQQVASDSGGSYFDLP